MKAKKNKSIINNILIVVLTLVITAVIAIIAAVIIRAGNREYTYSSYPIEYQAEVEAAAEKYNVDKYLIYAVIKTESDFDPDAESPAGAVGLMQIMPISFEWIQTMYAEEGNEDLTFEDMKDPALNIDYGTHLLSLMIDMFGNEETAVCAYNGGLGNVQSWLEDERYSSDGKTLDIVPIEETSNYRELVMRYKSIYTKLYSKDSSDKSK